MSSEIFKCSKCGFEFDVNYKDDEIVSQQACKCKREPIRVNGLKLLDWAILNIEKGIKNERFDHSTGKVSVIRSEHTKK